MELLTSLSSRKPVVRFLTLAVAGVVLLGLAGLGICRLMVGGFGSEERHLSAALLRVLPGASRFQRLVYAEGTLQAVTVQAGAKEFVYAGYGANGAFVGYAILGEGPGYQGTIKLLYGYKPEERRIIGVEVLVGQETPGWGEQIQSNPVFLENFRTLAVDPRIAIVRAGEKTKPNQVEAITGATVSCNSVVSILDRSTRRWLNRLPPAGAEPPPVSGQL